MAYRDPRMMQMQDDLMGELKKKKRVQTPIGTPGFGGVPAAGMMSSAPPDAASMAAFNEKRKIRAQMGKFNYGTGQYEGGLERDKLKSAEGIQTSVNKSNLDVQGLRNKGGIDQQVSQNYGLLEKQRIANRGAMGVAEMNTKNASNIASRESLIKQRGQDMQFGPQSPAMKTAEGKGIKMMPIKDELGNITGYQSFNNGVPMDNKPSQMMLPEEKKKKLQAFLNGLSPEERAKYQKAYGIGN